MNKFFVDYFIKVNIPIWCFVCMFMNTLSICRWSFTLGLFSSSTVPLMFWVFFLYNNFIFNLIFLVYCLVYIKFRVTLWILNNYFFTNFIIRFSWSFISFIFYCYFTVICVVKRGSLLMFLLFVLFLIFFFLFFNWFL